MMTPVKVYIIKLQRDTWIINVEYQYLKPVNCAQTKLLILKRIISVWSEYLKPFDRVQKNEL